MAGYAFRVPRRSNLFQEVVAIIYRHLADGEEPKESEVLLNRVTGRKREVDVVLRSSADGHEFVIGVEAASRGRRRLLSGRKSKPISVEWVEQMIGKHKNLPTDKVILVSESGFTAQAYELAIAENMVPISPEMLGEGDPTFRIVNSVRSLWPKQVDLTPESYRVWVEVPGEGIKWWDAPPNMDVFAADGSSFVLIQLVQALIHGAWDQIIDQIGLADIAEDLETTAEMQVGPEWTIKIGEETHSLYVRPAGGEATELHRIDGLQITAKAVIRVTEIELNHRRLAAIDLHYSFGEGLIGTTPALIVATEDSEHGSKLSIRLNPRYLPRNENRITE